MRAVVTFHHVGRGPAPLAYPLAAFASMLDELGRGGPPPVDLDALLAPGAGPGVALVFDDGCASLADAALPLLRDAGVPAHLFLCTGGAEGADAVDGRLPPFPRLDWNGVERLHRAGVAIEAHTHEHADLTRWPRSRVEDDCARADAMIEQRLGRRPRYFAYPGGCHDANARAVAAGRYAAAFGTRLAALAPGDDRYALPRIDAHYLRHAFVRRLDTPASRAWIALRRSLRRAANRS